MGESYSDRATTAAGDAIDAAAVRALRVYCAGGRPEVLALVRETLRSFLAGVDVETGGDALPGGFGGDRPAISGIADTRLPGAERR